MSKFIRLDTAITDPAAPFAVLTPGVSGYDGRYIASHVNAGAGDAIGSWNPVDVGDSLKTVGGLASTVKLREEDGMRFLRSTGGPQTGGRLLAPHREQRPLTIAAVVRATVPNTAQIVGMSGVQVNFSSSGTWSGVSGQTAAYPVNDKAGWIFALLSVTGLNTLRLRADSVEAVSSGTVGAAPAANGGLYFGPGSNTADIAELVTWPRELNLAERDAVHTYMRSQYPVLD